MALAAHVAAHLCHGASGARSHSGGPVSISQSQPQGAGLRRLWPAHHCGLWRLRVDVCGALGAWRPGIGMGTGGMRSPPVACVDTHRAELAGVRRRPTMGTGSPVRIRNRHRCGTRAAVAASGEWVQPLLLRAVPRLPVRGTRRPFLLVRTATWQAPAAQAWVGAVPVRLHRRELLTTAGARFGRVPAVAAADNASALARAFLHRYSGCRRCPSQFSQR